MDALHPNIDYCEKMHSFDMFHFLFGSIYTFSSSENISPSQTGLLDQRNNNPDDVDANIVEPSTDTSKLVILGQYFI